MTPASAAKSLLISILVLSLLGVLFARLVWQVARRNATSAVIATWLGAALVVASLMTLRIHRVQTSLGIPVERQARIPTFRWFLPMWLVAFGAVVLSIRRRVRTRDAPFSASTAARSLGAFWIGVLAYFIVFAAMDIAGLNIVRGARTLP